MFTIGLSLHSTPDKNTDHLDAAFASSEHSAIASWSTGAVTGTKDGSVFILHVKRPASEAAPEREDVPAPPVLHLAPLSALPSRAASPTLSAVSSSHAPFNVTSKPRVVAGITKEKAEAPKNYVDYDDEPGKLKNILQGRAIRDGAPKQWASSPKSPLSPQFPHPITDRPKRITSTSSDQITVTTPARQHPPHSIGSPRDGDLSLCCMVSLPYTSHLAGISDLVVLEDIGSILVLQQSGILTIISSTDGTLITSFDYVNSNVPKPDESNETWVWTRIHAFRVHEEFVIFATARQDERSSYSLNDKPGNTQTRLVTFVYNCPEDIVPGNLGKLDDIVVPSPESCVAFIEDAIQGTFVLFRIDANNQIVCRRLRLNLHTRIPPIQETQGETPSRSIHNPFKKVRQPESSNKDHEVSRVEWLGEANFGCVMNDPKGIFVHSPRRAIIYSEDRFCVLAFKGNDALPLYSQESKGLVRVVHLDDKSYCFLFKNRLEFYSDVTDEPKLQYSRPARQTSLVCHNGDCYLHYHCKGEFVERIETAPTFNQSRVYSLQVVPKTTAPRVTSTLPIDLTDIILGFSNGVVKRSSLVKICGMAEDSHLRPVVSDVALGGTIITLFQIQDIRTNERLLVGGADDGSVAVWNLKTLELRARWVIFTTRLYRVIHCTEPAYGTLRGCILCISIDGTIAVIVLDGFQLLYLIPGSPFPLERICLGGNDLLLFYSDYRARLWDIRTREFWRSLTDEKAEELLKEGDWITLDVKKPEADDDVINRRFPQEWLLEMNLERFVAESNTLTRSISTNKIQTRLILDVLTRLKAILSILVTPGLDPEIDDICENRIGTIATDVMAGTYSPGHGAITVYGVNRSAEPWCISPDVSASRAIGLTLILRALSLFEECAEDCATVIAFYATSLSQVVGPSYRSPSLIYLAKRWFDGSNETRGAIRALFDAALMRLPDDEAASLVDRWQHYLPCLQPTAARETESATLALFLCGHIAAEKYSLLSTVVLTDVAKSIAICMTTGSKALGIDLCARGFHVWEHYIDAMDLLRTLFTLATTRGNKDKEGVLARNAVLQIATKCTPTFMTTLGLDIQSPTSIEHRKSVLQIVAVLIRKRPGVLEPNLPKLMEAVVKSLDPNSTTSREAVLDTATEILKHVVDTFSTVDFDAHSQRLAVGTCEGVVVMYDLKTAIRLYVLEGHHEPVTAVSFSEDGRRLVTVAVAERLVLVWKVGTSFSNLFSAGGGHKPFKQFPFEGGQGDEKVKTEWTAARSCRVHIGELVLGFST